jgi:hypothetical protein
MVCMNRQVAFLIATFVAAMGAAALLVGCSTTVPVAVIGQHGEIMRGTSTASLFSGGSFSVTDGKVTCSGSYNALNESQTITMPVLCTDGRRGIITATRDSAVSGGGKVRLSDGTEADFIFGEAAQRI